MVRICEGISLSGGLCLPCKKRNMIDATISKSAKQNVGMRRKLCRVLAVVIGRILPLEISVREENRKRALMIRSTLCVVSRIIVRSLTEIM